MVHITPSSAQRNGQILLRWFEQRDVPPTRDQGAATTPSMHSPPPSLDVLECRVSLCTTASRHWALKQPSGIS
uniref:Cell surface hydrophobicity-associated protein n=1 Tax=Ganoderma boninense TaxID=34458 RepID=A0A5K1JUY2_9APHY